MSTTAAGTRPAEAVDNLEQAVSAALETYANVHRGSGHHSLVSTHLYECARDVVLEHLGLSHRRHVLVFGTPRSADALVGRLAPGSYEAVSSRDLGVPLGVRAVAVDRRAIPGGVPPVAGGGTARLVGPGWVMWATAPDRFEAGTPAIVNVIAFARALQLARRGGAATLGLPDTPSRSATDILHRDDLGGLRGGALLNGLRERLMGRDVRVPTVSGRRRFVNLDNAASTPTFEPVWAAVRETWRQPVARHQAIVQEVRTIVADTVGAPLREYDILFTANTTDAIDLVAACLRQPSGRRTAPVVINTLLEHNSNELPWRTVGGIPPVRVAMDADGLVDTVELEARLQALETPGAPAEPRTTLVAVSGASNVLGVCQDLEEIVRVAHRHGAHVLVDGAQLVAHRKVCMQASGIDALVFSGHKVYAPFGTGVLVVRRGLLGCEPDEVVRLSAAGEENVGGIAALGKALLLLGRVGFDVIQAEEQALTGRVLDGLRRIPRLRTFGITDPASSAFAHKTGVIPFDLKGTISHSVGRLLAVRGGIGVRSGCHCAHLTVKRMLGVPAWAGQLQRLILTVARGFELPGVVRVSLAIENTVEDVDVLLRTLEDVARNPKRGPVERAVERHLRECCAAADRLVFGERPSA